MKTGLSFFLHKDRFSVFRLPANASLPMEAFNAEGFLSITRTGEELSIVCMEESAIEYERCEKGWKMFQVKGPLDFSLTGILAEISSILANAGISLFAISTYDTDYILVKEIDSMKAMAALQLAGHVVETDISS